MKSDQSLNNKKVMNYFGHNNDSCKFAFHELPLQGKLNNESIYLR